MGPFCASSSFPPKMTPVSDLLDEKGVEALRRAAHADLRATRNEYLFTPPLANRLLVPLLNSPRDAPILYLFLNVLCLTLPAAAALFCLAPASHLAGAAYFALNYTLFLQRFMLALHYSEHRRLFRSGLDAVNLIPPLLLAPFFGVPSGLYRVHHCVMHHVGNNKAGLDTSSTEPYQRSNPGHFLKYWARYAIAGWVEVPIVALRARRYPLFCLCLATEAAYLSTVYSLHRIAPVATTWAFIVPFCVSSFALMIGNWSQHVFIDPSAPRSNFSLTYNCVNCPDNAKSFNDGYHIVHHHNSGVHWADLPTKFLSSIEEHAAADALVFVGIGFFEVGVAVMARQWGFLVRHLARYSKRFAAMSDEELAAELQRRVRPVGA